MKYVLFLQSLDLSRENTRALLRKYTGQEYNAVWIGDPELKQLRDEVEVLVTAEHKVDRRVLDAWPQLKMVSMAFTGHDGVDRDYCRSRGLKVYFVPDYSSDSVAELTVGLALSVLRKIIRADRSTREGFWDHNGIRPGIELHGKKVGIFGIGHIGIKSAKLFQAFGCIVTGWARAPRQDFLDLGFKFEDKNVILAESDVVLLHLPLDKGPNGTRHIVGKEQLALMRPTSILINTARSELVDIEALVAALKENRIAGAGIDVFDKEPVSKTDALLELDNIVVTPHLGFKTEEALQRLAEATIENIGRFLARNNQNRLD